MMLTTFLPPVLVFLSAFLLFQVELMVAKAFLPFYGGSYMVWGACMVFFQAFLLLGYMAPYVLINKFGLAKYRLLHVIFLLLPLINFTTSLSVSVEGQSSLPMVVDIFLKLVMYIGPAFFVLSTNSIIWQVWVTKSIHHPQKNPYFLYAVSNIGSFLGLWMYPFAVEFFFDLSVQFHFWKIAYIIFAALSIIGLYAIKIKEEHQPRILFKDSFTKENLFKYFLPALAASVLLIAVTNIVTYELPPVPLLWIIPLSIYLLTFVLNFKSNPWYPSWIDRHIDKVLGLGAILFFVAQAGFLPFMILLGLICTVFFIVLMFCQRQLVVHQPQDPNFLTTYYFLIALGGFVGSLVTVWGIPLISNTVIEYLIGLLLVALIFVTHKHKPMIKPYDLRLMIYFLLFMVLWFSLFSSYNFIGMVILWIITKIVFSQISNSRLGMAILIGIMVFAIPYFNLFINKGSFAYATRNYYGINTILKTDEMIELVNGSTLHGSQFVRNEWKPEPISYYSRKSTLGRLMTSQEVQFNDIAVIGLGTGTINAYIKPKQNIDFYELDKDMYGIANKFFTFIKNCAGNFHVIFGDARVSFDRHEKKYDLIIVDAFGGDSIPTHLLTREMVIKYKDHLNPKGILLFHISNRYIDLQPVLTTIAASLPGTHLLGEYFMPPKNEWYSSASKWIAFVWDEPTAQTLVSQIKFKNIKIEFGDQQVWTDEYTNILPYINMNGLLNSIRYFMPFKW